VEINLEHSVKFCVTVDSMHAYISVRHQVNIKLIQAYSRVFKKMWYLCRFVSFVPFSDRIFKFGWKNIEYREDSIFYVRKKNLFERGVEFFNL
jgi:hypothetical protein